MKKDTRLNLKIHPFYLEKLNKIVKANLLKDRNLNQRIQLETLIDNAFEDLIARNLIK